MATIMICDICGTRNNVHRSSFVYDKRLNVDDTIKLLYDTFELCDSCELRAYKSIIAKHPFEYKHELNREMIDYIRDNRTEGLNGNDNSM